MAVATLRESASLDVVIREFNQLVAMVNEHRADFEAMAAKLDADAGVTDTNYVATVGAQTNPDADTLAKVW